VRTSRWLCPGGLLLQTDKKLKHLSFFEVLSKAGNDCPDYRAVSAGLVTLRLVDAWLHGVVALESREFSTRQVRSSIDAVDDGTVVRPILNRLLDAASGRAPDVRSVITPLMAYGQALEFDARWELAADVYHTLLAHLHPIENSEACIAAHLRLGSCHRNLNRVEDASIAYAAAGEIGASVGDMVGVLRARIGEAYIATFKGNLPKAQRLLDDTIEHAVGHDLADVRSRALHDRSGVAILSGQYELAIRFAYDALELSTVASERDKILNNIAGAFALLGVYSAARDAYLVLSTTAQDQYTRWAASLNLLDVSSMTGMRTVFEEYRRQLLDLTLPPQLATAFELTQGQGFYRFGEPAKARFHLERAIELAAAQEFNQYLIEAEQALAAITEPPQVKREATSLPLDLQEVAGAIRSLRATVGAT